MTDEIIFMIGDMVEKESEDSYFFGQIVSIFEKTTGVERLVVESPDGVLHIMSPKQVHPVSSERGHATLSRLNAGTPWKFLFDLSYTPPTLI